MGIFHKVKWISEKMRFPGAYLSARHIRCTLIPIASNGPIISSVAPVSVMILWIITTKWVSGNRHRPVFSTVQIGHAFRHSYQSMLDASGAPIGAQQNE